jgi:hypothetical protein
MHPLALLRHHLLFLEGALALYRFFVEQRLDAYPPSFAAEMSSECVCPCEPSSTAPVITAFEFAFAYELLLSRV